MDVNGKKLKRSGRQESYILAALALFLLSYGCGTLSGLSESEVQSVEIPPAPVHEQPTEPVVFDPPAPVKNEHSGAVSSVKKPLTTQQVRQIQERLKAAGFDPGPIDGILGPKTRSVLLRVQAGCMIVNELVAASDTDIFAVVADTQRPESTRFANAPGKAEIQLMQKRLKAAGFDPGPIDGILGPRTKSAISRCKSGCTALSDLLRNSDERASGQSTKVQPPPAFASAKTKTSVNKSYSKEDIRLVQERLKAAGFDPGPVDGVLGRKTASALDKYRSSQKLTGSGIEALLDY